MFFARSLGFPLVFAVVSNALSTPHVGSTTAAIAAPITIKQGGFLSGTQTGSATFYSPGLGACGFTNTDADLIAAVSLLLFNSFPGYNGVPTENPICGRTVTASYQGKSVKVAVTDRCTGCAPTDLDFSTSAFEELANPDVGSITGITWVLDD